MNDDPHRQPPVIVAATLSMLLLGTGCSGGGPPTAQVSGKVTLDGQPLANVSVLFQPTKDKNRKDPGVGSFGLTDAEGRFTMKLSDTERPGAVVGTHSVTLVEKADPNAPDAGGIEDRPASQIPAEYSDGSKKFEVKPGTNSAANFELQSSSP